MMKVRFVFVLFILLITVCCGTKKQMPFIELISTDGIDYRFIQHSYELFPLNNRAGNSEKYIETLQDANGIREGAILNGNKQREWKTIRWYTDSLVNKTVKYIGRLEYFQNGLQDSTYTIYATNGKILYSTIFDMGTGVEKDFHENGKLYYEIAKKDGYFTDTLRLFDRDGKLMEKRLYEKDVLIYNEKIDDQGTATKVRYQNGTVIFRQMTDRNGKQIMLWEKSALSE